MSVLLNLKRRELNSLRRAKVMNQQVYKSNISTLSKITRRQGQQSLLSEDYKHALVREDSLRSDIKYEEGLIDRIGANEYTDKKVSKRAHRVSPFLTATKEI